MERRPALGKGLSALIPDAPEPRATPIELDLDLLEPNAFQPRTHVETMQLLERAGLRTMLTQGVAGTIDKVLDYYRELLEKKERLPIDMDGIVIKVNALRGPMRRATVPWRRP